MIRAKNSPIETVAGESPAPFVVETIKAATSTPKINFFPTHTLAHSPTPIHTPVYSPTSTEIPVYVPTYTFRPQPTPSTWLPLYPLPIQGRFLIKNGSRGKNEIALTFDLCQTEGSVSGFDEEIIDILIEAETPATFFLGGLWMRDHVTETLLLGRIPFFELGNHSWSHLDFSKISTEVMRDEILLTQEKMWDILGYQTTLFRFPFGTYSNTALNIVGEQGLYSIQWDVVSGDPDPNILAVPMTEWVIQQVQNGSIIIMHANGRGWHTAEALPMIINALTDDGYKFVTVSELLGTDNFGGFEE